MIVQPWIRRGTARQSGLWLMMLAVLSRTDRLPHAVAAPPVEGAKTLLMIRATTAQQPREPISTTEASQRLRQVSAFYVKNSGGRLRLNLIVTPLLRLAKPDYGLSAFQKAQALGFDYRKFDIVIVAHGPEARSADAQGTGATRTGGFNDLFGCYLTADSIIHELGHAFGLPHAGLWRSLDGTPAGRGKGISYRFNPNDNKGGTKGGIDFRNHPFDGMNYGQGDFNARFKNYLDWLPDSDVQTITESGTYRIAAHDMPNSTGTRALKIPIDTIKNYWLEFRRGLPNNPWLMDGALVQWTYNDKPDADLLDMTPNSSTDRGLPNEPSDDYYADFSDAPLVIGRTFSDTAAGIHLTPIGSVVIKGRDGKPLKALDIVVQRGHFDSNQPPQLSIKVDTAALEVGDTAKFTATATDPDGDKLIYYWDFGDGHFRGGPGAVDYSWYEDKQYTVRCTVSDMKGGTASASLSVKVGSGAKPQ